MTENVDNKSEEMTKYDEEYYLFMTLSKIIWTLITGTAAIIILGEPTWTIDYIFSFIAICAATIAIFYSNMFNTPEKLKKSSKLLKNDKKFLRLSIIASFVVTVAIIAIISILKSTGGLPISLVVSLYFILNLISLYSVHLINKMLIKRAENSKFKIIGGNKSEN